MKQDFEKNNPFTFSWPANIDLSPTESSSSKQLDPNIPDLSKEGHLPGKESYDSDIDLSAEQYFSKFKDFLIKNDPFVMSKDVVKTYASLRIGLWMNRMNLHPLKKILFDSTFDSTTACDIAEPLEKLFVS